jgi:hypothetical protein
MRATRQYASTYILVTAEFSGDVDPVAVERAVNGERPETMTTDEKVAAARILDERGFSMTVISGRIGVKFTTVQTWKVNGWDPNGEIIPIRRPLEPITCPSVRGYRQHLRRGESCAACCAASTEADRLTREYRLSGKRAG